MGTQNEVNQNGGTYRYVAWRVPGSSVISIGLTSDGTVSYGTIFSGESRNTVTLGDTQTVENTGTLAVDVNIKTQAPAGWDLAITPAPNTFTHDFSIDNGGSWSPMALDDTYELMSTNLDIGGTRPFDLRITAPNHSVSNTEKVIPVILQAVENFL